MSKIPVGLQLYTLREETAKDFVGMLKKVAEMGYQVVEFAGYGDIPAKEMRKVLDDLGLKSSSSHVMLPYNSEDLASALQQQIEYNLEIGTKYLIAPWAPIKGMSEPHFKNLIGILAKIGEEVKKSGLQFGYHNHDFEFEKLNGEYLLDLMYQGVPADLMVAEMDLYWVTKAGLDAKSYIEQYKGRVPLVHVKDMTNDERRYFAEVGQGTIDFKPIFAAAQEIGIEYYIVEQDQCERPALESIKMSIDYLKSIGIA